MTNKELLLRQNVESTKHPRRKTQRITSEAKQAITQMSATKQEQADEGKQLLSS